MMYIIQQTEQIPNDLSQLEGGGGGGRGVATSTYSIQFNSVTSITPKSSEMQAQRRRIH